MFPSPCQNDGDIRNVQHNAPEPWVTYNVQHNAPEPWVTYNSSTAFIKRCCFGNKGNCFRNIPGETVVWGTLPRTRLPMYYPSECVISPMHAGHGLHPVALQYRRLYLL